MLYEITVQGSLQDQMTINRWTYNSGGTPASVSGSYALADAFGLIGETIPPTFPATTVFGRMLAIASGGWRCDTAFVKALYDVEDFYERPFPGGQNGSAVGTVASPALAYGFRSNRVRLDVARGTKRIAGVSEDAMGGGGVIESAWQTGLNAFATLMGSVISYDDEGSTISFTPVVCGKQEYTAPSGKRAYRYYPSLATQLEHTAIGVTWQALTTIRTQVSRQYGRGQ